MYIFFVAKKNKQSFTNGLGLNANTISLFFEKFIDMFWAANEKKKNVIIDYVSNGLFNLVF